MKMVNVDRKNRRKRRVSTNITGTSDKPRIVVFRSNRYIYAQAVDDVARRTIVSFSSLDLKEKIKTGNKVVRARAIGVKLADKLKEKKINTAVFDRSSYAYLGRVKSLCEGLREGGIKI